MLKKILFFLLFILLFQINNAFANTLIERTIDGHKAKIIEYDTSSKFYDLKIGVHPKDGGSLREIMNTVGGISGVNGVFECPKDYKECGGKNYTINERYINGQKRAVYKSTGDRVVFAWNKNYKPFLFQTDKINKNKEKEIWEGFANHPLLLKDGIPQTEKYHELGLISYKMKINSTRNFICSNKSGNKIYFGLIYDTDIDNLAIILKDFGCWNALNLDAGYSTAMIYNGKYITGPQREILDGVFIVPKNINTKEIENKTKNIIKKILKTIKNNNKKTKIKKLESINKILDNISQKIYKNSEIIIYKNIKSEKGDIIGKIKIGTKTEIKKPKTIEKIYLINILREYTSELIKIYSEIPEYKYIKKLDIKVKINSNVEL